MQNYLPYDSGEPATTRPRIKKMLVALLAHRNERCDGFAHADYSTGNCKCGMGLRVRSHLQALISVYKRIENVIDA